MELRRLRPAFCLATVLLAVACLSAPGPERYRLTASGSHWDVVGRDRVLEDLRPRYPGFFAVVLDPARSDEPNLLALREDLERQPTSRRNPKTVAKQRHRWPSRQPD